MSTSRIDMKPTERKNQQAVGSTAAARHGAPLVAWSAPFRFEPSRVFFIPLPDLLALIFFVLAWTLYARLVARSQAERAGLMATMHQARHEWMRNMEGREVRIVDTAIMGSLQNGTAFFASTSLLAIGGAATLLRATDDAMRLFSDLPLGTPMSRGLWELKVIGLAAILGYAFFKFSWAYRLFNYSSILIGATPPANSPDAAARRAAADRAARMTIAAGTSFAAGQRAFYFSFAYLGWFLGPYSFFVTTILIAWVVWRRQFHSEAVAALRDPAAGDPTHGR